MVDASAVDGFSLASAKTSLEAANAAATSAPERAKSRRDKVFFICGSSTEGRPRASDMRGPALLVLAPPALHCFRVVQDATVFRVQMQLAVDFPGDVGKLQHGNSDVADRDRSVEFLAFTDACDEVREVGVGHGIAALEVRGRGCAAGVEFARFISLEIVNLVVIAIDQDCAGRAHD